MPYHAQKEMVVKIAILIIMALCNKINGAFNNDFEKGDMGAPRVTYVYIRNNWMAMHGLCPAWPTLGAAFVAKCFFFALQFSLMLLKKCTSNNYLHFHGSASIDIPV